MRRLCRLRSRFRFSDSYHFLKIVTACARCDACAGVVDVKVGWFS